MKEFLIHILLAVGILAISLFVAYLIWESNMPDWLKFWLLS